jgi:NADPH2:quinone reductase
MAAIQLAKHAGARVIGTSSSAEKLERLEEFGLDIGIDTSATDFVEAVRGLTDGEGVDLVLDSVGGSTLAKSIQACRYRGRIVTLGVSGRDTDRPDPVSLWRGNKSLHGIYFPDALANENARVHAEVTGIVGDIARGLFEVVIDREFPLREAEAAHRYVMSRQGFGRVIIKP